MARLRKIFAACVAAKVGRSATTSTRKAKLFPSAGIPEVVIGDATWLRWFADSGNPRRLGSELLVWVRRVVGSARAGPSRGVPCLVVP